MYIHSEKVPVSLCAEGTAARVGIVSLRPPRLAYFIQLLSLCAGNTTSKNGVCAHGRKDSETG